MSKKLLTALLLVLVLAPASAWAQRYDDRGDDRGYGRGDDRGSGRENRWVRIINDSFHTVVAVYAVPSQYRDRYIGGRDWIPTTVIRPGQSYDVNFNDGRGTCYYDIRAAGSNRRDWISRDFDVCRQGSWRLVN